MRRYFAMGGALMGLLFGAYALITAYQAAPHFPGPFEIVVQGIIVVVLAAFGAGVGFLIGLLALDFLRR